jgi:hypothetical protein
MKMMKMASIDFSISFSTNALWERAVHAFALRLGLNYGRGLIPLIEQYTHDFG